MFWRLFDIKHWRAALIIVFVVAGIVTPADPRWMFLVAVPMYGVYLLIAGLRVYVERRRSRPPDPWERLDR
jgi:Sec-independent protein secretion pathway component TatC